MRLEAYEEATFTLNDPAQGPRRAWIHYGGSLGASVDVTGTRRVLALTAHARFADPLQNADIPFTDLVSLGGDQLMPPATPSSRSVTRPTACNLHPLRFAKGRPSPTRSAATNPTRIDYECIPSAVFSHPPLAGVGLTEAAAREKFGTAKVYTSDFWACT